MRLSTATLALFLIFQGGNSFINSFTSSRVPITKQNKSTSNLIVSYRSSILHSFGDGSEEFVNDILNPPGNPNSPSNICTHMIAIPLEQNHDLQIELESIQRGILYNCPLLIQACIAPIVMRMPLLLVDTNHKSRDERGISTDDLFGRKSGVAATNAMFSMEDDEDTETLLTSRDPNTKAINEIVNDAVQKYIYSSNSMLDREVDDDVDAREGRNSANVQPLLIKFEGLEIDGDANNILHAIGTEENATPLLREMMNEIILQIEKRGWKAYLPPDEPQGKNGGLNDDGVTWRPRIPFMRLPSDFVDTLPNPKGSDGNWEEYSDEAKACYVRKPEEGGNGISPIFWYKWWDDKLCNGKGVRLREIAVYGRTSQAGVSENAFYIPHLKTKLPDGNSQLKREEDEDRKYDRMRRDDSEISMDFDTFDENDEEQKFEKQFANFKSTADRRMLETVYDLSPDQAETVNEIAESIKEETREELKRTSIDVQGKNDEATKDNIDTSKTKEIIDSIAKPIKTGDWSNTPKKKKPLPKDNPILKNWKERVTMAAAVEQKSVPIQQITAPYPSDEHFAGIWKLLSTPTGSVMDEEEYFGDASTSSPSSKNENLILRIDGTTAGGPILDVQNGHRAAGGTWKIFSAEWCGEDEDDEGSEPVVQTRLRVRLLIPPAKDQILVMEGEVKRGAIASAESISRENARELFSSSSFGMNNIANTEIDSNNDETVLSVAGEAWIENVSYTGDIKRSKLGRFSMMKMEDKTRDQYQYSIPAPTRYQD
ncbi:hypothetical protein CTEN210_04719 [Chaetoceros tenuissimus]|uniref:Uncharacterized protein n=1 Tax=Chaetoceros tenuissimus TaxID=426638 RepID=A0AAD3H314_9STRA|nr:hypothetical protein CTEN210_04719 [Chaetoceros tenuissimus]